MTKDTYELVRPHILRALLEGEKRYTELKDDVWKHIKNDAKIGEKEIDEDSFRVMLNRWLNNLSDEGLVKRNMISPKNVRYSIKDGKATEKAKIISSETLFREAFAKFLKSEKEVTDAALHSIMDGFISSYWMRICEAIASNDEESLTFYKVEGGKVFASLWGSMVDLFNQPEHHIEAEMITKAKEVVISELEVRPDRDLNLEDFINHPENIDSLIKLGWGGSGSDAHPEIFPLLREDLFIDPLIMSSKIGVEEAETITSYARTEAEMWARQRYPNMKTSLDSISDRKTIEKIMEDVRKRAEERARKKETLKC